VLPIRPTSVRFRYPFFHLVKDFSPGPPRGGRVLDLDPAAVFCLFPPFLSFFSIAEQPLLIISTTLVPFRCNKSGTAISDFFPPLQNSPWSFGSVQAKESTYALSFLPSAAEPKATAYPPTSSHHMSPFEIPVVHLSRSPETTNRTYLIKKFEPSIIRDYPPRLLLVDCCSLAPPRGHRFPLVATNRVKDIFFLGARPPDQNFCSSPRPFPPWF